MKKINEKTRILFEDTPIRKALFKLAWPSLIMMLTFATYSFTDSVLSINLADQKYNNIVSQIPNMTSKDLVRLFMTAGSPINSFLNSIALLFSVGVGVRFSIHLGRHDRDKALVVMRTGFMVALILSLILIPALLLTAKGWMGSLYNTTGSNSAMAAQGKNLIVNNGFSYIWIIIASTPLIMINQLLASLLRSEGRPKEMAIAAGAPLLLNILFDYVFMGPLDLGVAGGAWATVLSYVTTSGLLVFFISKHKNSLITFKNLFGFSKISLIAIIGIFLVGASPFLRNFAQSITTTFENRVIGSISGEFNNGDIFKLRNVLAGVFPVFMLAFPLIFSFTQAGSPLASYNYGAKNYKRVKETYIWTIIYSVVFGIIVYAVIATPNMLGILLLKALGVQSGHIMNESIYVIRIMLSMLPVFGFVIGTLVIFMSTDRIVFSLFASSLRGFILFFPMLYLFQWLSIDVFHNQDVFWYFYPSIIVLTAIICVVLVLIVFRHLETKHKTLDQRIEIWGQNYIKWKNRHFGKKKNNLKESDVKKTVPIVRK